MAELAPGNEFAGCVVQGIAGRGGMGVVYRARQVSLDRAVALKLIDPRLATDPEIAERFRREALAGAAIEHPNVVPVYDAGELDGSLFILMRLVDGPDLGAVLAQEGSLPPKRAAAIVAQVADALAAAHERGLVHRDVKPANVMVDGDRAYLTDFGVARLIGADKAMTRSGAVVGSVDYVAPEQVDGGVGGPPSDIYSLGCVLYECLTGVPPFPRETSMAAMFAHVNEPIPWVRDLSPSVPGALDEVVHRAMQKAPEDRFSSAAEMAAAIRAGAEGEPGTPVPPPVRTPTTATLDLPPAARARSLMRRPWMLALLAVLAIAATALGIRLGIGQPSQDNLASRPISESRPDAAIDVGSQPEAVVVAESVWVANAGDGTVTRIDPDTRRVQGAPIRVGRTPDSMVESEGVLWVTNQGDDTVSRIDTRSGKVLGRPVRVGAAPEGIAASGRSIWVANAGDSTLTQVDSADPTGLSKAIHLQDAPAALAYGESALWITNPEAGTVTKLDPRSRQPDGDPIAVGVNPRAITIGFGYVWVANAGDGTVVRIDPNTSRLTGSPIRVGDNARGIAAGPGAIWVTSADTDSVTRIDPAGDGVPSAPIPVGDDPVGIAVGGGGSWVANRLDDTVTPIHQ